jgi:hypothetical protein
MVGMARLAAFAPASPAAVAEVTSFILSDYTNNASHSRNLFVLNSDPPSPCATAPTQVTMGSQAISSCINVQQLFPVCFC